MRSYILLLCCAFTFQLSWSQNYTEKDLEAIQQFLTEFSKAAEVKDTTLLKIYIFLQNT